MQKKLYFLDESEKKRILNLHESRTKKQYLMEQGISNLKSKWRFTLSKTPDKTNFFDYSREIVWDVANFCKSNTWEPSMKPDEIEEIVYAIAEALRKGVYDWDNRTWFTDRGVTQDSVNIFESKIKLLKSVDNFCTAVNLSSELKLEGEENLMTMFDEISDNSIFQKQIITPLSQLSTERIQANTEETTTTSEWPKEFECVKSYKDSEVTYENEKWKKVIRSWGSEYFSSGGLYYKYKDKEEIPKGKNNYYTYYCTGGKPYYKTTIVNKGESSEDTSTGGGSGTGGGLQPGQWKSLSPQYDEKILKAIGKEGKTLTDDDIKTLYNKLKSAGKI